MGDLVELARLIKEQEGVITRAQTLECGLDQAYARRRVRRREWVTIYPGIYLTHTGDPTWLQLAWCAVLDAWPAVLCGESALHAAMGEGVDSPIHIAVAPDRRVSVRPGVVVHHDKHLWERPQWNLHPPRARLEEAILDIAASASESDAIAALADPVQGRLTTAERLLAALEARARIRLRRFIFAVLRDVRDGTRSVLEHRFLTNVERPHGLPTPIRQSPTKVGRPGYRDLEYPELGLVIELDGFADHGDRVARARDLRRDLDAAAHGGMRTLRICFKQATVEACATALLVGKVMSRMGWAGAPTPCADPHCAVRTAGR